MTYKELEQIFAAHEASQPKYHLDGYITFSDLGSHEDPNYTMYDRTYIVSSDNKAYKPNLAYCRQCKRKSELAVIVSRLFAELDDAAAA